MTTDLDRAARERLEALSAAVPVAAADEPVTAVRGSPAPRFRTALPLGGLLVAAVVVALIGLQPRGGGPSTSPASSSTPAASASTPPASPDAALPTIGPPTGPVVETETDGTFELEMELPRLVYGPGETINPDSRLTYLGPDASIEIFHGSSPVIWSIAEVGGDRRMDGGVGDLCAQTVLVAGNPLDSFFQKSGFVSDDPTKGFDQAWFEELGLHLPSGTWRISVTAAIATGACGGESHSITAALDVVVLSETATADSPAACRMRELEVLGGDTEAAGGELVTFVVVGTTGSEPCRLADTRTHATLRTPSGDLLADAAGSFRLDPLAPHYVDLDPAAGPLRPDGARPGQGLVMVFVGTWCADEPTATLEVTLPQMEAFDWPTFPLERDEPCTSAADPVIRIGLVEHAP